MTSKDLPKVLIILAASATLSACAGGPPPVYDYPEVYSGPVHDITLFKKKKPQPAESTPVNSSEYQDFLEWNAYQEWKKKQQASE